MSDVKYDVYDIKDKKYLAQGIERKAMCKLINIASNTIYHYVDKGTRFYGRYIIVTSGNEVKYKEVVNDSAKPKFPEELLKEWDRVTGEAREYIKSRKVMACNR